MRIMILWDVYKAYTEYFYLNHPSIKVQSYDCQLGALLEDFFYWPPYMIQHFRALGHEAEIVFGNVKPLQLAWAREHDVSINTEDWHSKIVVEQIKRFLPDVLFFGGADHYLGDFAHEIKVFCKHIVAWKAVGFSNSLNWNDIDCVLSSHMIFIEQFRKMGVPSEQILPCFEPRILEHLQPTTPHIPASFVGSLSTVAFSRRMELLNYVRKRVPLQIYAEKPDWRRRPWPAALFFRQARFIPFLINARRNPAVYGLNMFQMLHDSKMTLNIHVDSAKGLAGNIRMFEATGVGTLLITEAASNLARLFEPDREVVTYHTYAEAVEKIQYYLEHPVERESIASAGQQRTHKEYNSRCRAEDVISIFQHLL